MENHWVIEGMYIYICTYIYIEREPSKMEQHNKDNLINVYNGTTWYISSGDFSEYETWL